MPSTTWLLSRLGVPTRLALAIFSLRRQRVAEVPDARRLALSEAMPKALRCAIRCSDCRGLTASTIRLRDFNQGDGT
ncbi:MAG: hypothetical protein RMX96_06435 [Nostoc sp. ChiSLP02]|nr:hypothetical protein [Nostoc sp. DedSLP05]MDZ8099528.1 hypothetical protein [Nostoc sp. DedSLP01]MDZ8184472.1 hypothetical protein [Nostoc sp. ChiSLP02]